MITKFFREIFRNIRAMIAFWVICFSFAFLFMLITVTVPYSNKDIIMMSAGIVLAALTNVVNYYFGSSKDRADNDKATIDHEKVRRNS